MARKCKHLNIRKKFILILYKKGTDISIRQLTLMYILKISATRTTKISFENIIKSIKHKNENVKYSILQKYVNY